MHGQKKKKILFFTENYERGGGNRYLFDLACMANQNDNEIVVYSNCLGIEPIEVEWFKEIGVPCKEIAILSWGELRAKYKLRSSFIKKLICRIIFLPLSIIIRLYQLILFLRLLKSEKPDLIVGANGGYPAGGAVNRFILAGALLKIRCFYSVVNVPSLNIWDKIRMFYWDRIIPKHSEKIIVDSKEIKKQLNDHHFQENQITILYNGLKGNLPYTPRINNKVKILFFARIEEIKGIEYLIESIKEVNKDLNNKIEFHFYGDGTLAGSIKNLASEFRDNVFFYGFFEGNFQNIFSSSDIYILPSLMEGLPYTVLEAMKTGCCIISTQVGGLPELITNRESGILIKPKSVSELSAALREAILNPTLREQLGRAAKEKFDQQFEQSAIFRMHSGLFDI